MTRRIDQAADHAVKAAEIAAEASRQSRLGAAEAGLAASEAELAKEEARREREPPSDRLRATELALRFENCATARLSPRHRRHAKLAAFDERVAELEGRMGEVSREQAELRDRIPTAEAEYAEALARFHASGKGARPTSAAPALEEKVQQLAEDYAALEALVSETLSEKAAWVESHRDALVKDARASVEEAAAAYRAAVDGLAEAREELVAARIDELYFALFPHEAVTSAPPSVSLVGGIPARLRTAIPGLQLAFGMPELRRLLAADGEFVQAMRTPQQAEALRARDGKPPAGGLTWAGTPEHEAELRREREERRDAYIREWGVPPAW